MQLLRWALLQKYYFRLNNEAVRAEGNDYGLIRMYRQLHKYDIQDVF